jgi:hypothetical protein
VVMPRPCSCDTDVDGAPMRRAKLMAGLAWT